MKFDEVLAFAWCNRIDVTLESAPDRRTVYGVAINRKHRDRVLRYLQLNQSYEAEAVDTDGLRWKWSH